MNMIAEYTLRGHHLELLKLHFYRHDYGLYAAAAVSERKATEQDATFAQIIAFHFDSLISNPWNRVMVTDGIDDVCATCTSRRETICRKEIERGIADEEETSSFDAKSIRFYGLENGETYFVKDLLEKLR